MAPVWLFECGSSAGGGAAAEEVTMLLVADVTLGVELEVIGAADVVDNGDDDEVVGEFELELDNCVELTPELLDVVRLLCVVVGVVAAEVPTLLNSRLLELSVSTVLELSTPEVSLFGSVLVPCGVILLGTVTVPRVVGSARLAGLPVKVNVSVCLSGAAVIPLAAAATLVARSLAVPQPYWKNPPSKTFL